MTHSAKENLLRQIPAVHSILDTERGETLIKQYGRRVVIEVCNEILDSIRERILTVKDTESNKYTTAYILTEMESGLRTLFEPHLKKIVNATGIILHTNFGRAILSKTAQDALISAASGYTNLEYDTLTGKRGSRYSHVESLLRRLTGAESALVVNNNAAAVLLLVNTLAADKEVVVSRGQLVEIGGSFRIPEVLKMGRVNLIEVGTTNKTYIKDYREAINVNTALLLRVHTSNFCQVGFIHSVNREELVQLGKEANLPIAEDLGSGSFSSEGEILDETSVQEVVASGVDVVTFSGDKLLGGPQAGIIVGKKKYLDNMKRNQLTRALRVDKFTLAALEATLKHYLIPETIQEQIPIYQMLNIPVSELKKRAEELSQEINKIQEKNIAEPINTLSQMGGGSVPGQMVPSWGIAISCRTGSVTELGRKLRQQKIPIIGYIDKERYILDMRTLLPGDDMIILEGFSN